MSLIIKPRHHPGAHIIHCCRDGATCCRWRLDCVKVNSGFWQCQPDNDVAPLRSDIPFTELSALAEEMKGMARRGIEKDHWVEFTKMI